MSRLGGIIDRERRLQQQHHELTELRREHDPRNRDAEDEG